MAMAETKTLCALSPSSHTIHCSRTKDAVAMKELHASHCWMMQSLFQLCFVAEVDLGWV
jgi:hypothetical protein